MYGILMNKLAIIVTDYDEALNIREELKKHDLFERLSFDVGRMMYFIYLKPVNTDNYNELESLVNTNKYRLVRGY